ncbi:hypothetical protein [Paraburkholderia sp. RL17-337-BIB-A]|uniref:hypothetical protein n=1 Tax=Paraburkholderia sp. RL17-337-BIB-A TaxID=3031636 RepID=UPI0038BB2E6C
MPKQKDSVDALAAHFSSPARDIRSLTPAKYLPVSRLNTKEVLRSSRKSHVPTVRPAKNNIESRWKKTLMATINGYIPQVTPLMFETEERQRMASACIEYGG